MSRKYLSAALVAAMALTACGGGGGGGGGGNNNMGTLTIAMTDAPVDIVQSVNVQFTGVTLKPAGGSPFDITFQNPVTIDLKTLNSGNTDDLLNAHSVPVGDYEWMRLNVNADGTTTSSNVVDTTGSMFRLEVPSGDQSGLKLVNGFTVTQGGHTSFVIDWNLRQGLMFIPGGIL